jgi:hypothetical protein
MDEKELERLNLLAKELVKQVPITAVVTYDSDTDILSLRAWLLADFSSGSDAREHGHATKASEEPDVEQFVREEIGRLLERTGPWD